MQPGEVLLGRFEVERLVGRGGMGEVYRARDAQTGDAVAIKSMVSELPGAAARFEQEAQVLAQLRHRGIVRYVAHGAAADGAPFLAMEWLDGEDLAVRIARLPFTVAEALEIVRRAAEALEVAHEQGIVHRDVKPSNIFLEGRRVNGVRVLDFGVARARHVAGKTSGGLVVGTLAYMAPEQARAAGPVDARADVFALGCVLFECLAGRPAFAGIDVPTVLMKILLDEPPSLRDAAPSVPPAVEALVGRMLAKSPLARPANGADVARAIAALDIGASGDVPLERRALSEGEARWLGLVVAAGPPPDHTTNTDKTAVLAEARGTEQVLATLGARVERLADGALLAVVTDEAPGDLATRSSRIAEAMRRELPEAPIAIAFGRGEDCADVPVGEVVERAARELRRARSIRAAGGTGIAMDESTARLLATRFEVKRAAPPDAVVSSRMANSRRRTPFVGRGPELCALEAMWREVTEESVSRVALVIGEPGAGKSRLCDELLRSLGARRPEPVVWLGAGNVVGEGAAFGLVAGLLGGAAGVLDGEPLEARQAKVAALAERCVAAEERARVVEFVAELIGAPFGDESPRLRAARADARLMGDQFRSVFEDLVAGACRERSILLVLEDVHWGDRPSIELVGRALNSLDSLPWMVVALARPEAADVPVSWSAAGLKRIPLSPLARRSAETVVRAFVGAAVANDLVGAIVERGGGNPFALEELARAAADGRTSVPDTVLAMTQARLDALDPVARRTLRAASVFGQVSWAGGVACLLGDDRREVERNLDRLVSEEALTEAPSKFQAERAYAFRHAIVREAAYAMLTEGDGALGHRLAAAWLVRHGETNPRALAHHFERGKQDEAAATWWCRAARDALRAMDLPGADALATRGLGLAVHADLRAELWLVKADAAYWAGDGAARHAAGIEAMRAATRGTIAWQVASAEAASAATVAEDRDASVRLTRAVCDELALAASEPSPAPGAQRSDAREGDIKRRCALLRLARALYIVNDREHGDAVILASGATEDDDPLIQAWLAHARAAALTFDGDAYEALRADERAAHCFAAVGDQRHALHVRGSVANSLRALGAYQRAAAELELVRADARKAGLVPVAAIAALNLGFVHARLGSFDKAREFFDMAEAEYANFGVQRLSAAIANYRAEALLLAGDLSGAEAAARTALVSGAGNLPEICYAKGLLARVALARGDAATALELGREALAIADEEQVDEGDAMVRLTHAEALLAVGDAAATQALADARARILARAERIPDLALRATFLVDVAENARTLALADRGAAS